MTERLLLSNSFGSFLRCISCVEYAAHFFVVIQGATSIALKVVIEIISQAFLDSMNFATTFSHQYFPALGVEVLCLRQYAYDSHMVIQFVGALEFYPYPVSIVFPVVSINVMILAASVIAEPLGFQACTINRLSRVYQAKVAISNHAV